MTSKATSTLDPDIYIWTDLDALVGMLGSEMSDSC